MGGSKLYTILSTLYTFMGGSKLYTILSTLYTGVRSALFTYKHQQGGEAGWDVVGGIVDAGGHTAEQAVSLRALANHGVERGHHLVCQHTRRPQQQEPEQGGDDAVAHVLGQRLQCRRAHLLG